EPIGPADRPLHQLGAHHVAVERVGALPVEHMDHAMIELGRNSHRYTPSFLPTRSATTRRSSLSLAPRFLSSVTISGEALFGEPERNGGSGSYSIWSWICFATSSPSSIAATASAKS